MANWQPFAAQNVSLGANNGLPNSSDWIFIVDSMINQWYDRHNTSTVILLLPYLFSYSGQLQNDKHPSHNYGHMSRCHSLPQNTNHCHYHHKILPLCTILVNDQNLTLLRRTQLLGAAHQPCYLPSPTLSFTPPRTVSAW